MKLLPQDLGARHRLALLHRRGRKGMSAATPPDGPPPRLGALGRRWTRGTVLEPEMAAQTLALIRRQLRALRGLSLLSVPLTMAFLAEASRPGSGPEVLLLPGAALAWAGACWTALPRAAFRRVEREIHLPPITAAEIAALLPGTDDNLERAYLTLAMDVVRQDVVASGADADLRGALRALGDAIDRLPATRAAAESSGSPDILTEVLRRTAQEALLQAQAEPDRVVAASLVRRAEALERRADATQRAGQMVRHFGALRQEMAAETEALRAGLAAYYTGAHDIADLIRLADDIRRVAAEAAAITSAREELDEASAAAGWPHVASSLSPETGTLRARPG